MNKVTMLEIILLSIAVTVSSAIMFTPYLVAQAAGQDAWISVVLAGLLAAIPAWAAGKYATRFPKQSFVKAVQTLFGNILGKLAALIFAGYFLFAAVLALWRLEAFSLRFLLSDTPLIALAALFVLCVAWTSFMGSIPLIRTSAYLVPAGMVVIFLVVGLPVAEMDPSFLTPIFEEGYPRVLSGAFILLGYLCQVPLVIMVFQRYAEAKFHKNCSLKVILGVLIAALALEMGAAGTLAVFGPAQTATMYYPAYEVARIVSLGNFLEHLEVAFIAVWIVGMLITTAFYVQAFADTISDVVNIKGQTGKIWIYAGAVLVLFFWRYFIPDVSVLMLIAIIRDYGANGALVLGGVLPVLMLARVIVAPPRKEKDQTPEESNPEESENPSGEGEGQKQQKQDGQQGGAGEQEEPEKHDKQDSRDKDN